MGLLNCFRNRRERESATSPTSEVAAPGASSRPEEWSLATDPGDRPPAGEPVAFANGSPGADDVAQLLSMVGQAIGSGSVQIYQGETQIVDGKGVIPSDQILEAIRQMGADLENQPDLDGDGNPG